MKVEVKKVDALRRELSFEVPRDRVTIVMDDVYKEIGKHAKIKGFRPGKAPRALLVQAHGKLAQEETIKKLIPEVYHEGITKEKLEPIDLPQITNVAIKEGVLTFTAALDIRPQVKAGSYKGISVAPIDTKASNEDVEKSLEFFKKGRGGAEGKEAVIDDAFAHGMGFPSLDEFKKALIRQLEFDKDRQNRIQLENQIVDHLLKHATLDVPQSLVGRQFEYRVREMVQRMKSQGLKDEDIARKIEEVSKNLKEAVERDVKVFLVLEEIGKLEKIEAGEKNENLPAKVMEFLLKEAKWQEVK